MHTAAHVSEQVFQEHWGKAPIWRGGRLPAANPRPRDFAGDMLLQMDRPTLAELGGEHPGVAVVGHPVRYSSARDKRYVDIDADPGEAYWPFLRLGLARFQPWSVDGAHCPRRSWSTSCSSPTTVRCRSPGPSRTRCGSPSPGSSSSGRRSRPASSAPVPDFSLTPGRGVRAWVEQRGELSSDLDWTRVGRVVDLARIDEDELMRVWQGDVDLLTPLPLRRAGVDPDDDSTGYRVVVTEWESLLVDDPFGDERASEADRLPRPVPLVGSERVTTAPGA